MRLVNQLTTLFTDDPDQLQKFLDQVRTLDDNASTLTTQASGVVQLAASEADTPFAFGEVTTAKYVLVLAKQAVNVKINGTGNAAFKVEPLVQAASNPLSTFQKSDQPGQLFIGPTNITSLHFTEPGGTAAAEAFVLVVGEGTP